jgi:hypothetical protein
MIAKIENSLDSVNDCDLLLLLQSAAAHFSVVLGRPVLVAANCHHTVPTWNQGSWGWPTQTPALKNRKQLENCDLLLQSAAAHFSVVLGRPVSLETVLACRIRRRILTPDIRKPQPANMSSYQCCGSGIRCLFDPWIRNRFFPDPGSQPHIFESLVTIFWAKSSIIL